MDGGAFGGLPWGILVDPDGKLEDELRDGGAPNDTSDPNAPQYIDGDPSQGTWNTTPPAGGVPPKSPSGHNWYTDEELAAWDAAGRPPNHDYLNADPNR